MTTIAITATEIAADTMSMFGDMKHGYVNKIVIRAGHIFAITGNLPAFDAVISWYLSGHAVEKVPEKSGDWNLIAIDSNGRTLSFAQDVPYPCAIEAPVSFGTGEKYAQGALDVGASASEAVSAAIKRDPQSGGTVQVVRFADVFGLKEAAE